MQENTPAPNEPAQSPDDMLPDTDAARYLGVAVQSVRNWRWKGIGPKYHRVGQRMVRYRRRDLDAFIERGAAGTEDAA